ncbi:hypothetical protein BD560DRAFT_388185 [Blakeslea trispora]|nr:hypothetical protein BD560DRAFT_388185 [Blakeslea trispora]
MNSQDIINALNQMQIMMQRSFMNESQNMSLKFNELAHKLEQENQRLREEVVLLRNEINVLTSIVGNRSTSALSLPAINNTVPDAASNTASDAGNNGLFSGNLAPLRNVLKKDVAPTKNFCWDAYRKLAEKVLGRVLSEDEFKAYCKDNVNLGLLNPLMYSIKKKHNLFNSQVSYAKLPANIREEAELLLEEKAAPFLPLAACAGRWGAKLLLMKMWRRSSRQYAVEVDQGEEEEEEDEEEQEEEHDEGGEHNDVDHHETDVPSDLSPLALDSSTEQDHAEVDKSVDTPAQRKRGHPSTKAASEKSSAGKRTRTSRR